MNAGKMLREQRIRDCVAAIPPGHVAAYGQIAELAGLARGARQVTPALRGARAGLPWHRVVAANGRVTIPQGDAARSEQIRRLTAEGVPVVDGCIDMRAYQWQPSLDELVWGPAFDDGGN